jgi:hypothetical protein
MRSWLFFVSYGVSYPKSIKTLMQKKLLLLTFPVLFLIVFIACSKNRDKPPGDELPADKTVTASLQGKVVDEDGLPVSGAVVSIGVSSTTTDESGAFSCSNISLSSRFGFVKVVKEGYFTGSRSIITAAGGANNVSIQLLKRAFKGSFAASGGGTVLVQPGDSVSFESNGIVTASSNTVYSGNVHVYASYLDPTDKDVSARMPGDLRGIGGDGKETMLQSFGMMVVELEGDGGEKLQIAGGKKATISMKIPDALKGSAPATIPLWYFSDTTGKWIEQGVATRKGDVYVGQTTHFSWWNCDAPSGTVGFKVYLKDQHGSPMANRYFEFVSTAYGTRGGITDAAGYASGLIPRGQGLVLQVLNPCGEAMLSRNIDPALTDQDLGTLTVTDTHAELTVSGKVVDCEKTPVKSGYVTISVDGLHLRAAVVNGSFTLKFDRCSASPADALLVAGDYGASQEGKPVSLGVSTGTADAGTLTACGHPIAQQFFDMTFNGKDYHIATPRDTMEYVQLNSNSTFIDGLSLNDGNGQQGLTVVIKNLTGTGTKESAMVLAFDGERNYAAGASMISNCTITAYGEINGFVEGHFTGTLQSDGNTPKTYPMSGSFRVLRTY